MSRSLSPTPRQRQVLQGFSVGFNHDEIAAALGCSRETVRTHVQDALRRTGTRNRSHAIATAIRRGWIS